MEKIFFEHPWIIMLILLWTLPWKGVALWIAARRGHIGWFLFLLILNTLAILDILYIFIFSKLGSSKNEEIEKQKNEKENEKFAEPRQVKFSASHKSRSVII